METDDISTPGWDAINKALKPIYADQEPKHYGTVIKYRLGGPDPLDGISAYKRLQPVPHWHFVTYGFSELYEKDSDVKEVSGCGFELTFRLKTGADSAEPPAWAMNFLQNLARYVFKSGNAFQCGDYMNCNGPIALENNTLIRSIAFVQDPELVPIDAPHGRVEFIQIVGITEDEELALKQWATLKALAVMQDKLPLYITDLARKSLLTDSQIQQRLTTGATADGSNTDMILIDQLSWAEERRLMRSPLIKITLGARQIRELLALLPYRLPYKKSFGLLGQQAQVVMEPSDANGYRTEGPALRLNLSAQSVKELTERLVQKAGEYEFDSFPNLRIQVKQTMIKDHAGKVVETIG